MDTQQQMDCIQQALADHNAGRLDKAADQYQAILNTNPNNDQALHLLGLIYYAKGSFDKAIELIKQAITQQTHALYLNNLGNVFLHTRDAASAQACFAKAVATDENDVDAHINLASLCINQKAYGDAIQHAQKALAIDEAHPLAHYNLALAYQNTNDLPNALTHYEKALEQQAHLTPALNNMGNVYRALGHFNKARTCYERSLTLDHSQADTHYNMGLVQSMLGEGALALAHYNEALKHKQDHLLALCALGKLYQENKQFDVSYHVFSKALQVAPDNLTALAGFIDSCLSTCRFMEVKPYLTQLNEQIARHLSSESHCAITPFLAMHFATDMAKQQRVARHITQTHAPARPTAYNHRPCGHADKTHYHIGYLSPDFNEHCVGLLLRDLFSYHDRAHFTITGFDCRGKIDKFNEIIRTSCDQFIDISDLDYQASAKVIHDQGIDILLDLAGHTGRARPQILAYRPAPIQCHFLGDSGTMGASYIDYYLTSALEVPYDMAPYFDEKLAYLPDTPIATSPFARPTSNWIRKDYGIAAQAFVYCCFNHPRRFTCDLMAAWTAILQRTENSVLWLAVHIEDAQERLRDYFANQGIAPERLVFAPNELLTTHWHHALADLYLDTFTLQAGTPNILSSWAGLPVLTRLGETPQARIGSALSQAAGVAECITASVDAYIDKAVYYYHHQDALNALKKQLLEKRAQSGLFQPQRYVQILEATYRQMWDIFQHQEDSASFCVLGQGNHHVT